MSSGLRYRRSVQRGSVEHFTQVRPKRILLALLRLRYDSCCGCPHFLCGPQCLAAQEVAKVASLPSSLQGALEVDEVNALIDELNQVLLQTHWPIFPLLLAHFCLPFSPAFISCACRRERERRYQAALDRWNAQHSNLKLRFDAACLQAEGQDMAYLLPEEDWEGWAAGGLLLGGESVALLGERVGEGEGMGREEMDRAGEGGEEGQGEVEGRKVGGENGEGRREPPSLSLVPLPIAQAI